jgi:hypothetical protein
VPTTVLSFPYRPHHPLDFCDPGHFAPACSKTVQQNQARTLVPFAVQVAFAHIAGKSS